MRMTEADVVWTPGQAVRVERHGSNWQRSDSDRWMPATCLGEMGEVPTKGDVDRQLLAMFILFNTLVVRDRVAVEAAHAAFLKIDEYRKTISPDTRGAEE
jgi:hypothetical protein